MSSESHVKFSIPLLGPGHCFSLVGSQVNCLYAAVCGVVSVASEVPFACIFLLCKAIQMQAD